MMNILLVFHLLITIGLVAMVLLQRSEGGGLGIGGGGGGGGGGGFMTTRGTANAMTRATVVLATLFFINSISLSIMAGTQRGGVGSVIDSLDTQAPAPITLPEEVPEDDGLPAVPVGD